MSNLLITVAIPVYNNEKTLKKALDSSINQKTDIEYEILIVDDASEDSTPDILLEYAKNSKVRVLTLENRVSLIDNHNVCLNNSLGEYVIFCHADDTLESHAIETIARKLKERNYPKKYVLWGYGMSKDFSINIKRSDNFLGKMFVGQYATLPFMYGGVLPSGTCYSRESFLLFGGFLRVNQNISPSDMTTMLYLAVNGFRFEMISEMILVRTYASTLNSSISLEDRLNSIDDAFLELFNKLEKDKIGEMLRDSTLLKQKPFTFYYGLSKKDEYKKQLKKIITKEFIKNPYILKKRLFIKIVKRIFSK
jgi:glycosyltransferase involved in cell wall biosynthesis